MLLALLPQLVDGMADHRAALVIVDELFREEQRRHGILWSVVCSRDEGNVKIVGANVALEQGTPIYLVAVLESGDWLSKTLVLWSEYFARYVSRVLQQCRSMHGWRLLLMVGGGNQMNVQSVLQNAATYLESAGADATAAELAVRGFTVERRLQTQRRTVWLGKGWVLKWDNGLMDGENPRWRRSPEAEAAHITELRASRASASVPATVRVGRVLIQERVDPDPRRFRQHARVIGQIASALGVKNVHSDNVGWRGRTPVFFDHDYTGPDLTVILLLKLNTKGREAQGEVPFWHEWGPTYLERMVRNVRRHLPPDTRIVVLTDRPAVVPAGCDTALLTEDHPGWWSKLWMFRREVTCGRCLYLDLDNVIAKPIPELLALTPDPMIMMDDRQMPGMPNASTMLFFAEQVRYLWDRYATDPAGLQRRFHESRWPHASDQGYTTAMLREHTGRFPSYFQDVLGDGYALNSRVELEDGAPWEKCRLVFGCWVPKPHESQHPFYLKHWAA